MDIKTTKYAMLLLYEYPLQKSTTTYCLSKMPMQGGKILACSREKEVCWRLVGSKLGICPPRPVGHPVYLKTDYLENLHAGARKSKKILYDSPKAISKTLKKDTWRIKGS